MIFANEACVVGGYYIRSIEANIGSENPLRNVTIDKSSE